MGGLIGGTVGAVAGGMIGAGGALLSAGASMIGGGFAFAGGGVAALGTAVAGVGTMALGGAMVIGGVKAGIGGLNILFNKDSRRSNKEKSTDKPSWVNRDMIDFNLSPQQNATNLLNNKYGVGKWIKGAASEFNKIVKWIARALFKG